jgi:hypothetical protein
MFTEASRACLVIADVVRSESVVKNTPVEYEQSNSTGVLFNQSRSD